MGPLRSFTPMVAFAMLSPAISIHLGQSAAAFPALPHLLAPAVSEADVILTGTFLSVPPAAPDALRGWWRARHWRVRSGQGAQRHRHRPARISGNGVRFVATCRGVSPRFPQ